MRQEGQEWGVVGLKYSDWARRAIDVGEGTEESSAGGRQEPTCAQGYLEARVQVQRRGVQGEALPSGPYRLGHHGKLLSVCVE